MTWNQIEQRWAEFGGSARAHWGKLTEADWKTITGTKQQLVACVQERYGVTPEVAARQVEDWSVSLMDIADPVKR